MPDHINHLRRNLELQFDKNDPFDFTAVRELLAESWREEIEDGAGLPTEHDIKIALENSDYTRQWEKEVELFELAKNKFFDECECSEKANWLLRLWMRVKQSIVETISERHKGLL